MELYKGTCLYDQASRYQQLILILKITMTSTVTGCMGLNPAQKQMDTWYGKYMRKQVAAQGRV